ncbi:MAG TPA: tyrosine-type recombinase/integrase [Actinomycetota bacterium]|nr:tyrosine-type recombinase/integrase [Actinomycetota bacterium]
MASLENIVLKSGEKRYRVWWWDPGGNRHGKRFRRFDEARAFARDVEAEKVRGTYLDPSRGKITVAAAWEKFKEGPLRSYKESTQAGYRFHFERYVLPALGSRRLHSVEKEDVEKFIHDLEETARASGRKLKAGGYGTREKTLRALQRFFSEMVSNGRMAKNPALGVKLGTRAATLSGEEAGGQALDTDEVHALLEATPAYWRPLVAVLATSGLRISEACGLRRRDLDLSAETAAVIQTVVEVNGNLVLTTPKSKASRRTVQLLPSAVALLKQHPIPVNPDGLLFTHPGKSDPIARTWFNRRVLKPAAERAGLYPVPSVHDLRHTAGAIASKAGMHPMAVKEMMGHSSIKVTFDVYGHLFPTMHAAGVAAIEKSLKDAGNSHAAI